MGKIRVAKLGDEKVEKELKRKAEARRQTKESKKVKVEEVEETKPEKPVKKTKKVRQKVRSKRYQRANTLIDKSKYYALAEAVKLVKKTSFTRFDGTVELHINLNAEVIGESKSYRATIHLPHGTGKQIRIVIADDALVSDIEAGKINFDILVAHPSMMSKLAKVARILGPRGLMPNPKNGTVTDNPEKRAKELSGGVVNIKNEPDQPLVHLSIGKVSFDETKLVENINAAIEDIGKNKIVKATLSATMSPGIKLALQ